jgi:pilus assembly protein CpaB
MKPKTIILLVVAVGCGLGASIMTSRLLADRNRADEPEPTVPVLVAKTRVAGWDAIAEPEKVFEIKQFPVAVAPKRPISEFAEIKGLKLNKTIGEGHMLLKDDLLSKEQATIADTLLPGQRAVAIRVNAASTVGGFVLVGSRVDVMATIRVNTTSTMLILQNMLVMAVDDKTDRDPERKHMIGQTVTLAATQEEAARLALAQSVGELQLTLKGQGDTGLTGGFKPITLDDLSKPLRGTKTRDDLVKVETPSTPPITSPLPEIPPEKKEETKVVVKEEPKVDPAPAQAKPRLHILTIIKPSGTEKVKFDLNKKKTDPDDDDDDSTTDSKPGMDKKPAPAGLAPKPAPGPRKGS